MIDALGHVCYAVILVGQLMVARHVVQGWLIRIAGTLGWIVLGLLLGLTSIWVWCSLFIVVDIIGYLRWKKDDV